MNPDVLANTASGASNRHAKGRLLGAYVDVSQLLQLRHCLATPSGNVSSSVVGTQSGVKLSKIKGRGIDFSEVRTYQPGDDIRSIDWRVTARKNKPHTKIFREERERPTLLFVDQSQAMFFASSQRLKSVVAAETAARVAWHTLAAGDRVGGVVVGNRPTALFRPLRSSRVLARFLNEIAAQNRALNRIAEPTADNAVSDGINQLRRLSKNRYRIILISDFSRAEGVWMDPIKRLGERNQVHLVHISDPLEASLPPAAQYAVTDGARRLQFHSGRKRLRDQYETQFMARCEALQKLSHHPAIRYTALSTHTGSLDLQRLG